MLIGLLTLKFRLILAAIFLGMDPETAGGEKPEEYAYDVVRAILRKDKEVIPWKFVPVVWLRAIFPSVYFQAMKQRYQKLYGHTNDPQIV